MKCRSPILIKHKSGGSDLVPCGRCVPCIKNKINAWVTRLTYESHYNPGTYFITLTYDEKHVPTAENGCKTVKIKDLQDFIKRLRYHLNGRLSKTAYSANIRYYAISEYGTKTYRPHYHCIIFSSLPVEVLRGCVSLAWGQGHFDVEPINAARIRYVLKRHGVPKDYGHPRGTENPRAIMSTKPGLGYQYLTESRKEYGKQHLDDFRTILPDGSYRLIPRYYADAIFSPEEKQIRRDILSQKYPKVKLTPDQRDALFDEIKHEKWLYYKRLKENHKL